MVYQPETRRKVSHDIATGVAGGDWRTVTVAESTHYHWLAWIAHWVHHGPVWEGLSWLSIALLIAGRGSSVAGPSVGIAIHIDIADSCHVVGLLEIVVELCSFLVLFLGLYAILCILEAIMIGTLLPCLLWCIKFIIMIWNVM